MNNKNHIDKRQNVNLKDFIHNNHNYRSLVYFHSIFILLLICLTNSIKTRDNICIPSNFTKKIFFQFKNKKTCQVNISQIHHTFIVSRKESSVPATVKKKGEFK